MSQMMDIIVRFIIRRNKLITKLFVLLTIFSILCIPMVGVNYDLSKYLPSSAPSEQGLDIMEDVFGYPGTARIMIKDCSIYEAKHYKDQIAALPEVDMIMWADSTTDIYQSASFLQETNLEDYYKDGSAVMDVTFLHGDADQRTHKTIDSIQAILGEKGRYGGSAVQNKSLQETLLRQISIAMIMGVFMIAVVLCLTTTSWFEPVMFLLIMGIAIVINMGTNIFLGTISFLTFSMASILQLAIAMDYSIFLLHTFTAQKAQGFDTEKALENAIHISVSSILSSGATTIIGFLVLALMQFSIGRDLGLVLAKGIVISLITVLFLMPAFILRWTQKVERTGHRPFFPKATKFAKVIYAVRHLVFIVIILLVVPAYVAQGMNKFSYGNDSIGSSPGTVVYADEQEINAKFGRSNLLLALVPDSNLVTERALSEELEDLPFTKSVTSLASTLPEGIPLSIIPESMREQLHKDGWVRMLITIRTAAESEMAYQCTDEVREIVQGYYPDAKTYMVGVTPSTQDIQKIITNDYSFVNLLSLLGVALVIMITFKSIIVAIVVMIPIEVAIFFNMAIPYIAGNTMVFMGYLIVSCLQLGATVDYSILLTNNYLDCRKMLPKKEAALAAIERSTLSVLTSGSILTIVGYGLYFVSSVAAIADIGRLVGRGALMSLVLVLSLLPALLLVVDRWIIKPPKGEKKKKEKAVRKKGREKEKTPVSLPAEGEETPLLLPEAEQAPQDLDTGEEQSIPQETEEESDEKEDETLHV